MDDIQKADGSGELNINGNRSPIVYQVIANKAAEEAYSVKITLDAPRDWLLKQGFEHKAILVREHGSDIPLTFDGTLDVDDSLSVTLTALDDSCTSSSALQDKYPELGTA